MKQLRGVPIASGVSDMNDQEISLETFDEFKKRFEEVVQASRRTEQNLEGVLSRVEYKSLDAVEKHMRDWWNKKKDKDLEEAVGRKLNEFAEDTKRLQKEFSEVQNPAGIWLESLKKNVESLNRRYSNALSISNKIDGQIEALKTYDAWFHDIQLKEKFESTNSFLNGKFEALKRSLMEVIVNELEAVRVELKGPGAETLEKIETTVEVGSDTASAETPPFQNPVSPEEREGPDNRIRQKPGLLDAMIADSENRILNLENAIQRLIGDNAFQTEKEEKQKKAFADALRSIKEETATFRTELQKERSEADESQKKAIDRAISTAAQEQSRHLEDLLSHISVQQAQKQEDFAEELRESAQIEARSQTDFVKTQTEKMKSESAQNHQVFREWAHKHIAEIEKEKAGLNRLYGRLSLLVFLSAGCWVGTAFFIAFFH